MAAGDVKLSYVASGAFDVTHLHSLAASQTWIAGWASALIDNTSNKYLDYMISGLFKAAASANAIGTIRVYVVSMIDDATWPSDKDTAFPGTEGALAVAIDFLNSVGRLGAVVNASAATANQIYSFGKFSVANLFGGVCPPKFCLYVTGNIATTTAAQFAANTNIISYAATFNNVAA